MFLYFVIKCAAFVVEMGFQRQKKNPEAYYCPIRNKGFTYGPTYNYCPGAI